MRMEVIVTNENALKEARTFVAGFHGLGEVGFIACKHLTDELKAERVATVSSSVTPPFVAIDGTKLRLPFEIFAAGGIAVFLPHFHISRYAQVEFSAKLADWVRDHFDAAFLVGGLDQRLKSGDENWRLVPTSKFLENPIGFKKEEVESMLLQEGLFVTGPLAVMIGTLDLQQFPALAVLAYASRERPDPAGAANAIKCLNRLLSLPSEVQVDTLIENARQIEEEMRTRTATSEAEDKDHSPVYT
jgi:uncharacterized protein